MADLIRGIFIGVMGMCIHFIVYTVPNKTIIETKVINRIEKLHCTTGGTVQAVNIQRMKNYCSVKKHKCIFTETNGDVFITHYQ